MASTETADGVLPVDKPAGPSSHDVVARARRSLGTRRIGHTGTLDPFASGLLLLCIGSATRLAEYLTAADKRYAAVVRLGVTTDTDDLTGAITAESDAAAVDRDAVERALDAQRGTLLQRPPAYSAKKVAGQRAYALARQGREVDLEPVAVHVRDIAVTRFDPPDLELDITCSSGTYIRAIARDLGAALGTGAHLTALRRTAIDAFGVDAAITLAQLEDPDAVGDALIRPLDALPDMPRLDLDEAAAADVRHGRAFRTDAAPRAGRVALAVDGELVAIAESDGTWLRPRKVFL